MPQPFSNDLRFNFGTTPLNYLAYGGSAFNELDSHTHHPLLLVLLCKTSCSLPRGERVGGGRFGQLHWVCCAGL